MEPKFSLDNKNIKNTYDDSHMEGIKSILLNNSYPASSRIKFVYQYMNDKEIPREKIVPIMQSFVVNLLEQKDYEECLYLCRDFPVFVEGTKDKALTTLRDMFISSRTTIYEKINSLCNTFHISEKERKEIAFSVVLEYIKGTKYFTNFQDILNDYFVQDDLDTPEIKEAMSLRLENLLNEYWSIKSSDKIWSAIRSLRPLTIPSEILQKEMVHEKILAITKNEIKRSQFSYLERKIFFLEDLQVSPEEIARLGLEIVRECLASNDLTKALEIQESCFISKEQMKPLLKRLLEDCLDKGGDIFEVCSKFPFSDEILNSKDGLQYEFALFALKADFPVFKKVFEDITVSFETKELMFRCIFDRRANMGKVIMLNEESPVPFDKSLKKAYELFGVNVDWDDWALIDIFLNPEKDETMLEEENKEMLKYFGVNKFDGSGINQLEQGIHLFVQRFLREDFDPSVILKNRCAQKFFSQNTRFTESQWKGAGSSLNYIVQRYIDITHNSQYDIAPLNPEFTPSEIIYVDTIDKDSKPATYTESFLSRFKTIKTDVQKAKEQYLSKQPLSGLIEMIEDKKTAILEELRQKINSIQNEKGKQALSERIKTLEGLNLRDLNDFQKNFMVLAGFKELESELRQAMFVMGFAKNRGQLGKDIRSIDVEAPALDDITWMINFVDHIVNKETMGNYFTDKQARNKFRDLVSVRALEEELSRFSNQETIGTLPMKFIPTRGILMEFSGHIADACWADKYDDTIPATFPNFTAVTLVQNPESKYERLCGSCMLIETRDEETGQPLLVIRGLNPIEGTINQLSVQDFYKKFTSYAKSLAEKTGRKLAIVVDDRSGGSATNRPVLYNYLHSIAIPSGSGRPRNMSREDFQKQKEKQGENLLKKVTVPYHETEFNGYDITHNVYLVD